MSSTQHQILCKIIASLSRVAQRGGGGGQAFPFLPEDKQNPASEML
jgi:hypothetical protein